MHLKFYFAWFCLCVALVLAYESNSSPRQKFKEFVQIYNKHYENVEEEEARFNNFLQTLKRIESKTKYSRTATYGITKFSDWSEEELISRKSFKTASPLIARSCLASGVEAPEVDLESIGAIPTSFDWRSKGVVTPVKNQDQCGSCWTFSTTGNIESQYAIKGNPLTEFSEQMIVDCSTACSAVEGEDVCNQGCNGGWMWAAMDDIMSWGGLETESAYPYTAETGTCAKTTTGLYAPLMNYTCIGTNETEILLNLLSRGPLSIAMNADLVEDYTSGIIDPNSWLDDDDGCDPTELDHALLIVGYGEETDIIGLETPYWIVKNSWGEDWGEQGYFRIIRGYGACGLNNAVTCSILE